MSEPRQDQSRQVLKESSATNNDAPYPGLMIWIWKQARRIVVFVIGSTVLLIGVAMIVLPGPAVIVIPLGLAILATEFVWARRWLDSTKKKLRDLAAHVSSGSNDPGNSSPPK